MRHAREIACSDDMGERGCFGGFHNSECDARTEAIQQAREDGARWELDRIDEAFQAKGFTGGCPVIVDPSDVRKVAP